MCRRERERENVCVCVCVRVHERKREKTCVFACVRAREKERGNVCLCDRVCVFLDELAPIRTDACPSMGWLGLVDSLDYRSLL